MRVIPFSRKFPSYHPRKGEGTGFMEKIWRGLDLGSEYSIYIKEPRHLSDGTWQIPVTWRDNMNDPDFKPKLHTIRAGKRWKAGDWFSPRVWSGVPRRSKQIEFAPPMVVKAVYQFDNSSGEWLIGGRKINLELLKKIATNDGLSVEDFKSWFKWPQEFNGQIICWGDVNY